MPLNPYSTAITGIRKVSNPRTGTNSAHRSHPRTSHRVPGANPFVGELTKYGIRETRCSAKRTHLTQAKSEADSRLRSGFLPLMYRLAAGALYCLVSCIT